MGGHPHGDAGVTYVHMCDLSHSIVRNVPETQGFFGGGVGGVFHMHVAALGRNMCLL